MALRARCRAAEALLSSRGNYEDMKTDDVTPEETRRAGRAARAALDSGLVNRAFGGAINYYVAMAIDLAAALAFLGLGVLRFIGHPGVAVGAVLLGFLSFGFLEYAVHRWVLHGPPSIARRGHRHHQSEPRALVATPFFVAAIASIAIWQLLCLVSPDGAAALFVFPRAHIATNSPVKCLHSYFETRGSKLKTCPRGLKTRS